MRNIRLFTKWLCLLMTLLAMSLPTWAQMSPIEQGAVHEIKGSITFKIEKKSLSQKEAQDAIGKPITLKVSMIMRGDWVTLLDKGFQSYFGANSFSFGIARTDGDNILNPAEFYKNDPPALIGASYNLAMRCNPSNPFIAEASSMYVSNVRWNENNTGNLSGHCPTYDYGAGFSPETNFNTNSYRHKGNDAKGDYYEIDLFPITLMLNRLENVYVRGIDDEGTFITDNYTDLYATSGTTELNLRNQLTQAVLYWPGAPKPADKEHPEAADWTQAPADYYGGVIPGGIFIEQVPEVTQFERSFVA